MQAGEPVNGFCNFGFSLWDALSGGIQIGDPETASNVLVSDGLFTVDLNFGASAFQGEARWLQIVVNCGGGATTLSPRQPLSPAPYALNLRPTALLNTNAALPLFRTYNTGLGAGLSGHSTFGHGVYGQSDSNDPTKAGVYGSATEGASGVYGESVDGPGGYFKSTNDDGVYVHSAAGVGVHVWSVGTPSGNSVSGVPTGFEVNGATGHGLWIGQADLTGIHISASGLEGIQISSAGEDGVAVGSAGAPGDQHVQRKQWL